MNELDRYGCFAELEKYETLFKDYLIDMRRGSSDIAVMAPHGGGIEFGTASIARSIANPDHTFWALRGIKKDQNQVLHITSTRFDAPGAMEVAVSAQVVVTVHGCRDEHPAVYVGGRHGELKARMRALLLETGFDTRFPITPALSGENPLNLCNRCCGGKGIQLEITAGLRKMMFNGSGGYSTREKTEDFFRFTNAVRRALGSFG